MMNVTTNHVQLSANGAHSTRYATHAPNYCGHSMSNGDTQKPTRHMRRLICSLRSQNKRRKSRSTGTAVALVHGAAVRNNPLSLLVASCIPQDQRGFCRLARCVFIVRSCVRATFHLRGRVICSLRSQNARPLNARCRVICSLRSQNTRHLATAAHHHTRSSQHPPLAKARGGERLRLRPRFFLGWRDV